MKKFFALILLIPSSAFAAFGGGISMANVSGETCCGDLKWNLSTINGVYESERSDDLAFQVKLGLGVSDDSDIDEDGDRWDLEIKNMIQLKGMYFLNDDIYASVVYTRADIEAYTDWDDDTSSDSESDFGFLLGYRKGNLDAYFGPAFDKDGIEILEFGFTYFFN